MKKMIVVLSLLVSVVAFAQAPGTVEQPTGIQRSGFAWGFSLGGGSLVLECEDCGSIGAFSLELHLGGMVSPNVGIFYDGWEMFASADDGSTITHSVHAAVMQGFFASRLWYRFGLGLAYLGATMGGESFSSGATFATVAGVGVELYQGAAFGFDLQVLTAEAFYPGGTLINVAFGLGCNWY